MNALAVTPILPHFFKRKVLFENEHIEEKGSSTAISFVLWLHLITYSNKYQPTLSQASLHYVNFYFSCENTVGLEGKDPSSFLLNRLPSPFSQNSIYMIKENR